MSHNVIRKAVFPVAGLGTRFLPATKAAPKEMLPVVDKPLIQYAVEEAYAAGIREMIFVTGRHKRAIEDHFDTAYELEAELEAGNKRALLELVHSIKPDDMDCVYVRQPRALGLGRRHPQRHREFVGRAAVFQRPQRDVHLRVGQREVELVLALAEAVGVGGRLRVAQPFRQAEVARQYYELQTELTTSQSLLWFTRKKEAVAARARHARDIERSGIELEAETARLRSRSSAPSRSVAR